ncbi:Uu.00g031050.m01.CDS01 [Anthostomella pinea]|uniref:Uu.00g031050.m01.CDS01 n=1 Tax=Anthostomella pinea TaxID=933095 RepID=A0AAI8YD19_9PEZI|nr:Uu.00g031050.m01.CDS01 [Anthostomella pinea]
MNVSLQNGLSQLKWIRFKHSRAPLMDMERFDDASRGTLGALKLLIFGRGGFVRSFGVVIALGALLLGPLAQQVVKYESKAVESLEGASVNRALNYTGALPGTTSPTGFVPILPLKSAVYNGLFAENGRPGASLAFECQTGNCTWDHYETLGVCSEGIDLTPFIDQYCASNATFGDCGWQVPQGAKLNNSLEVFSMTSQVPAAHGDLPHSMIMKLIFMGTEAYDGLAGEIKPWAKQCSLSACVQTLETTVSNGVMSETVVHSDVNQTILDNTDLDDGHDHNVYSIGSDGSAYMVSLDAMLSMRGPAAFNRTVTDSTVVVNLTVGISSGKTFFDPDVVTEAFYWNYYEYADGLYMLMRDTATSMTVAFRGFGADAEPVAGRALSDELHVSVRWAFAVFPVVLVFGTALFLVAAIYHTEKTGTQVWKSSALAVLFHGLDDDTKAQFGHVSNLEEQMSVAKDVKVQLGESDDGGSLLRT